VAREGLDNVTFAASGWLLLLGLLPLIVLLHVRRRRDLMVGSLVVWRRVGTASSVRSWRWSAPSSLLSLALQLLAVTAAALALARPHVAAHEVDHWIVLLDASPSMQAIDVTPSRFEAAIQAAGAQLASVHDGGIVTVIRVAQRPDVVTARRPVDGLLHDRLSALRPTNAAPAWREAARLAANVRSADERTSVTVFSDAFGAQAARAALLDWFLEEQVVIVGSGGELVNAGLAEVEVVPRGTTPHRWTAEGRLETVGVGSESVRIRAYFEPDGTEGFLSWAAVDVTPDNRGVADFSMALDLPGPGLLEVRTPPGDHIPGDDRVAFVLDEPVEVSVLRVGGDNPSLDRAIRSVADVALYRSADLPADTRAFDLVIVDGVDTNTVPATSTLWIGAAPPGVWAGDVTRAPDVTSWAPDHPLAADADWSALSVDGALAIPPLLGATVVVEASGVPLVQARTTSVGRQVVVAFTIQDSNWPAQLGFPAFIAALVDWSVPGRTISHAGPCRPGVACPLPSGAFRPGWRVMDPDGFQVLDTWAAVASPDDPLASAVWHAGVFDTAFVPQRAGRYRLVTDDGATTVLPIHGAPFTRSPTTEDVGLAEAVPDPPGSRLPPLWRWLALLAALAIAAEAIHAGRGRERFLRRTIAGPNAVPVRRRRAIVVFSLVAVAGLALAAAGLAWPDLRRVTSFVLVTDARGAAESGPELSSAATTSLRPAERGVPVIRVRGRGGGGAEAPAGAGFEARTDDLETALELARAMGARAGERRVAVVPASHTALSVEAFVSLADRLRADGVALDLLSPPQVAPDPVEIEALILPQRLRAGETFDLMLVLRSDAERVLDAEVRRDGGEPRTMSATVRHGITRLEVPVSAGDESGPVLFEVSVRDRAGAQWAEAAAAATIEGPSRVLLVTLNQEAGNRFAEMLELQGLEVDVEPPRRLPANLDRWSVYDVTVLLDVPAVAIHSFHQDLLEEWVRDAGGGLVILGGPNSYGPGGYFQTRLEEVSPLSARIPHESPEVTLVFVLDRSGSMQASVGPVTRLDIAKQATVGALDLLGPQSLVGVVAFDAEAEVLAPIRSLERRGEIVSAVERLRAGGGTAIYPGLLAAYEMLLDVDSATKHVIVMTDGLSQPGDFDTVLANLRAIGATTSFVGIGDGANRAQLAALAQAGGGSFHMTTDFRALPSIMAQEAMMLSTDPFERGPVAARWVDSDAVFLRGMGSTAPPLDGYVRTTLKTEATEHLVDRARDGAPLFASWRYGLGRVAAFASQGIGSWSAAWSASEHYPRFWAQVIRWSTPTVVRPGLNATVVVSDGVADLSVLAIDESYAPLRDLSLVASLVDPRTDRVLDRWGMREVSAGIYSTQVGFEGEGDLWHVLVEYAGEDPRAESVLRAVYAPNPVASSMLPRSGPSLETLAEVLGGRILPSPHTWSALSSGTGRWVWAWRGAEGGMAIVGLLAFLAALATRYLQLPQRLRPGALWPTRWLRRVAALRTN
jgi:uncharacterized membrane protein